MPTTKPTARSRKRAGAKKAVPAAPGARKVVTRARRLPSRASVTKPAPRVFEAGSGNVFFDMGLPDAEERLAKAELARILRAIVRDRIEGRGWTQAHAARELGIAAADMSNLMRGKLTGFSQERLEHFLTRLDMEVRIQVAPRPSWKDQAEITVERVKTLA